MICGYLPFEDLNTELLFQRIIECKITFPDFIHDSAKDLIKKILVVDPEKRISINDIKNHPFFCQGKDLFISLKNNNNIPIFLNNNKSKEEESEKIKLNYIYNNSMNKAKYLNNNMDTFKINYDNLEKNIDKMAIDNNKINNKINIGIKNIEIKNNGNELNNKKLELKTKKVKEENQKNIVIKRIKNNIIKNHIVEKKKKKND